MWFAQSVGWQRGGVCELTIISPMRIGASTAKFRRALLAVATVTTVSVLVSGGTSAPAPTVATPATTNERYAVRGVYDRDLSATGFDHEAAAGFNFIDSGPYKEQMDELAARGLKGFVWLGGYSNATCTFNNNRAWIRSHVSAIAGNPGVGAYLIDDEPDAAACPTAPAQIKARADLVKSIDPRPPTVIVTYKTDQLELFAGSVDIIGLDHYPCSIKNGCDYSKIDEQAAEADRLGIRYWGVIQAVGDDWYKLPTPGELHQQFVHWRKTNMEGYLVFAWRYPKDNPTRWLANSPGLRGALLQENGLP